MYLEQAMYQGRAPRRKQNITEAAESSSLGRSADWARVWVGGEEEQ